MNQMEEMKSIFDAGIDLIKNYQRNSVKNSKIYHFNNSSSTVESDSTFKVLLPDPISGVRGVKVHTTSVTLAGGYSGGTGDIIVTCQELNLNTGSYINSLKSGAQQWINSPILTVVNGPVTATKFTDLKQEPNDMQLTTGITSLSVLSFNFYSDQGVKLTSTDVSKFSLVITLYFE